MRTLRLLDEPPADREAGIALGQGPDCVQVVASGGVQRIAQKGDVFDQQPPAAFGKRDGVEVCGRAHGRGGSPAWG